MANGWIDDEMKSFINKKIKKIEEYRQKLTTEELKALAPEFKAHFKAQMKLPVKERSFYKDKFGGSILVVKTHKAQFNKLTEDGSQNHGFWGSPLTEGNVYYFAPTALYDALPNEAGMIIRGKTTEQYKAFGDKGNPMKLNAFLKEQGIDSLEQVQVDVLTSYTLNVWQKVA